MTTYRRCPHCRDWYVKKPGDRRYEHQRFDPCPGCGTEPPLYNEGLRAGILNRGLWDAAAKASREH